MKTASQILLGFCLTSATLAIPRSLQNPVYIGYQDSLGQYSFGYSAPESARSEIRQSDGQTRGSYSYVDEDGIVQSAEYTADREHGFRIAATNLPQAVEETPEVMAARAAHLEVLRLAYQRDQQKQQILGQQQIGQQQLGQQYLNQPELGQQPFGQQQLDQQLLGQQQQFDQQFLAQQQQFGQQFLGQQDLSQQEIGQQQFEQEQLGQQVLGQQDLNQQEVDQQILGQQQFGQQNLGQQQIEQQIWGQQTLNQQNLGQFGENIVVEAKIKKGESGKQEGNVVGIPSTKIVAQTHRNVVNQVTEASQSSEVDAARRAYNQVISTIRAKTEGEKVRNVVYDDIRKVSQRIGPVVEAVIDQSETVQHESPTRSDTRQGQVSSGSLLKTQGLSQSSGMTPASTTLIMKNQTFASEGFMGQANLKDKQPIPDTRSQLYRLAVSNHITKPLVVPSTYVPVKYTTEAGTPPQPTFAVQCFITRADQLANLVDVN